MIPALLAILLIFGLTACQTIQNYQAPNEPLFAGNYATSPSDFDGTIKVITWNIKFSEKIDTATAELSEVEELQGTDILLLQEMDEIGVEAIAQSLEYNYIYFPASIHSQHHKNFGNAILSKWPLSDPVKLLLPHENPKNKQTRIASRAVTTIEDKQVLVYSVHTETFWLSETKRNEQIKALTTDINDSYDYVLVGGDFNTSTNKSIADLEERLAQVDLRRVSAGAGPTFAARGLTFTTDHVFARGKTVLKNGVWPETEASDHFPLWVELSFDDEDKK